MRNENVLESIAEALKIKNGDSVIEIGPGHGELTRFLIGRGAMVFAIEKDKDLVTKIRSSDIGQKIKLIDGDALRSIPKITETPPLSVVDYKIVGNIPYYITGHLMRIIGELKHKPSETVLLIQKEVAQRICSQAPNSSLLSLSVGFWSNPKIISNVPREDFLPPPKVDSAVIKMDTKKEILEICSEKYYEFIKKAFKQPRKTLLNNLISSGLSREDSLNIIKSLGLGVNSRPQELECSKITAILC